MCAGRRMFPGFYAGFLCLSQAKHMRKKAMPYNEVNGVANPTMAREVPGSRDIRMDSGMRMQKDAAPIEIADAAEKDAGQDAFR